MKNLIILLLTLLFNSCAHVRENDCYSYCHSTGGYCSRVYEGERIYNTLDGWTEDSPTYYVCRYNR